MPALLNSTSMRPKRSIAAATAAVDRGVVAHVGDDGQAVAAERLDLGRAASRARSVEPIG